MLDTRWTTDDPSAAVTQPLRCNAPGELRCLIESTGLKPIGTVPGGAYDHHAGICREAVPLEGAMQDVAMLQLGSNPP